MTTNKKIGKSRHGIHKDGDVKVQYWTDLRKRRLLQYLAIISKRTLADVAWEGTLSVALRYDLIDMRTGGVRSDKWMEIEAVAKAAEDLKKARVRVSSATPGGFALNG